MIILYFLFVLAAMILLSCKLTVQNDIVNKRNRFFPFYTLNTFLPLDIDDCASNPCDQICKNEVGNYSCQCNAGYRLQGRSTCADIDECSETPSICGANAVCNNTVGSYECSCAVGFEDQSGSCVGM